MECRTGRRTESDKHLIFLVVPPKYGGKTMLPPSLTEAQRQSGAFVVFLRHHGTDSNARAVPYAERYRGATGLMPTPIERMQDLIEPEVDDPLESADHPSTLLDQ